MSTATNPTDTLIEPELSDVSRQALAQAIHQMDDSDFLKGAQLQEARKQIQEKDALLAAAVKKEEYNVAALLHKELEKLRKQDPMIELQELTSQMKQHVRKERYADAAACRDEIVRVRRYLPQYNLAGLWKGSYPGHGEEVVRISYRGDRLIATKVTGDPYVPAGQVSFIADVSRPPQESYTSLSLGDSITVKVEVQAVDEPNAEPLERFSGQGQVAGEGFHSPRFIPGELFMMEEDMLGFLWLPLGSFVVFDRLDTDAEGSALESSIIREVY